MMAYQSQDVSPHFIQSTQAAILYWQQRMHEIDDENIHQLDRERTNILEAVKFGLNLSQTWYNTANIALKMFHMVERQGYWQEWIPVLEQAILSCSDSHIPLKIKLLSRLGQLLRFTHQLQAAIEVHQKAEVLAQQLGDNQALAVVYSDLSEDYLRCRNYATTEKYGYLALAELNRLEGVGYWRALTLGTLGEMALFCGDLAMSEKMLVEAVIIRRKLEQSIPLLRTLNKLAITLQTAGKFGAALQCYTEASQLLAATPYKLDKVMVQVNLGALYSHLEQWVNAEASLRQVDLVYLRETKKIYHEAATTQSLGNVILKQGRLEEATLYLQRSVTLWQAIGDRVEQANSLETLGEAFVGQGRISEALPLYKKAIALLQEFPDDARARRLMAEFKLDWQRLVEKE